MKAIIITILIAAEVSKCFSQGTVSSMTRPPGDALFLRDYFTTPFQTKTKYADIDGSPFIDDNWALARLYIDSVQYFDSVKIRINAYENRIHYLNDASEEFQAINRFNKIIIIDNTSKIFGAVFQSGFYEQPNFYFRILADGPKIQLLQRMKVEKWTTKAAFEESKVVFQQEKELAFAKHNNLIKPDKDCSTLIEITSDDKDVLKFIKDNLLKCNKEDDMKRIVNFINLR